MGPLKRHVEALIPRTSEGELFTFLFGSRVIADVPISEGEVLLAWGGLLIQHNERRERDTGSRWPWDETGSGLKMHLRGRLPRIANQDRTLEKAREDSS